MGTLPIMVDMNQVAKLEEENPPPLPEQSANPYNDAPLYTIQTNPRSAKPRAVPPPSNEVTVPVLPPKPPCMK